MSRIGKLPITIPANVDINYNESEITVKGKFGTLQKNLPDVINITQENDKLKVSVKENSKNSSSFHGLYRTLINNMIIGVSERFELTLVLKGVGYRGVSG